MRGRRTRYSDAILTEIERACRLSSVKPTWTEVLKAGNRRRNLVTILFAGREFRDPSPTRGSGSADSARF